MSRLLLAALAAPPFLAPSLSAQAVVPAPRTATWRVEAGAALSRPLALYVGRAGLTAGVAPSLGVARAWHRAGGAALSVGARVARASLTVEPRQQDLTFPAVAFDPYAVGTLWQADVIAAAERRIGRRVWLHVGAGPVVRQGPDDVQPFRRAGGTTVSPAVELAGSLHVAPSQPLFASATVQAYLAESGVPGAPGTVQRVLVMLRYGR
jgi:hypothetical protein